MPWSIDTKRRKGILHLALSGVLRPADMEAFVDAHNAAVDGYGGAEYRVFCDLRGLAPLPPECTALFEKAKAHSAAAPNFRGSAVVVSARIVALQHERTSVAGGVSDTELITEDERQAWSFLAHVRRGAEATASRTVSVAGPAAPVPGARR